MQEIFWYVLMALAAHRLWLIWLNQVVWMSPGQGMQTVAFLEKKDNPYEFIRAWFRKRHWVIQYGASCAICSGVQIAAVVSGLWWLGPVGRGAIWILAVSTGLSFYDDVISSLSKPRPFVLYQQPMMQMYNTPAPSQGQPAANEN
jgi:hypothetical protein